MLYRLISRLPFPLLYGLAWFSYLLLFYVVRYRRDVVAQNLSNAFPEKSEAERASLARDFYRQFSQVALEIIKARCMQPAEFLERARILNPELLQQYSKDFSESVIVLTIHQGNWEWMLHGATTHFDIPISPVYKPLHNKAADKLIYDIRSQFGSRPLSMEESVKDIIRRRREFRIFVLVADQSPIRSERGYWTQFMNQEANFYLGAETIAKMTKFPVLYAQCHRRSKGHYEIEFKELAQPPYDKESHELTDRYVSMAEDAI
ncbi:MAG: lysophospholipid acyltransferase family protein, partial [Marinobacter sp.]|uniref:lysophospholipid acyltransferase family protein n=1 Tax=Marinobacter sp. TaxID=50741 RepID=UPI003298D098